MSETFSRPRLFSDFDGTAVEIRPKWDPRNWSKYPLRQLAGYYEFLSGIEHSGEIDFEGFISRRPNIAPRRLVTARTIARYGLERFFGDAEQAALLAGNEYIKARHLMFEAYKGPVVMLEDKPHKLGAELIKLVVEGGCNPGHDIVLGIVNGPKREQYFDELIKESVRSGTAPIWDTRLPGGDLIIMASGITGQTDISVVTLPTYSYDAGIAFARQTAAIVNNTIVLP